VNGLLQAPQQAGSLHTYCRFFLCTEEKWH